MNDKEFLREKEKLKQVIKKLENEKIQMDFKEIGEEKEEIYIGKISILDSENQKPIIIDWRAPISNLYYDGRIGEATYESPEGTIKGDISLKRQYFIENKILEKYVDIDLKTNDELLQVALEQKADERLKNIVATIQKEQNEIIRADMNKPLIVQGVAGSGKTTIALHRIAYLIYNTEKSFSPENFMIIAPNKFFLNYISNVLPDLGVEDVKQYTFEDFAYEIIGKKLKISDSNEKIVTIVNKEFDQINNGDIDLIIQESKYKSSINFKKIIDDYLLSLEQNYLPNEDFIIDNIRIMKADEIKDIFINKYKDLNFEARINEVKKHIYSKIKNKSDLIIKTIENKRRYKIALLLKDKNLSEEEKRTKRIEIFEETEDILKKLNNNEIKIVDFYFKKIKKMDAIYYYKDCIQNYLKEKIDDEKLYNYLANNTLGNLNRSEVAFEDLAPIIYLHYKIFGAKSKKELRHVIIDEAQDYGEFQFSVLKTILKSNSMTILGDIAQGIHSYRGIENWKRFMDIEFPEGDAKYTTLKVTYRTTKQIMEKANEVIEKLPEYEKQYILKGEPVIDSKDSINIYEKQNENEIINACIEKINMYKKMEFKSIAIIGKDIKECKEIKKKLEKEIDNIKLIQSKDSEYHAGVVIVPSYLAKGLEFDSVILFNVNQENYKSNVLDIKLLYVAITRAMSKLDIFYTKKISDLLL